MRRNFITNQKRKTYQGSLPKRCVPPKKDLFREIMHKHQGELSHCRCRWGHPWASTVRNLALPTCHVQKWWKTSASGGRFWYYKGGIMSYVYEKVMRWSSKLLWLALEDFSQIQPLALQIIWACSWKTALVTTNERDAIYMRGSLTKSVSAFLLNS